MAYMDSDSGYRSNRGGRSRGWNQWNRDQTGPRDSYAAGPSGRSQNGYRDDGYRQGGFQQREDFSRSNSSRGSGRGAARYSQRSWGQGAQH